MESDRVDTTPLSFTQLFNEACPQFMAIGLSYHNFWYGDPAMIEAYIKADEARRERENYNYWLQGAYTFDATDRAIHNGLISAGLIKGQKLKYIEKPFDFKNKKKMSNRDRIISKLKGLAK